MKSIAIIDYQINNLSSIFHAIKNLNYRPTIINEFDSKEYDVLVVPGTDFNQGIKYLKEKNLKN